MKTLAKIALRLFLLTLLFKITIMVNVTYFCSLFLFYFTYFVIAQLKELMVTHFIMIIPCMITRDK